LRLGARYERSSAQGQHDGLFSIHNNYFVSVWPSRASIVDSSLFLIYASTLIPAQYDLYHITILYYVIY
jgi:hypothetical protein